MNSTDFIAAVGAQYLGDAFGTSSGTTTTASTEYFNGAYEAFSGGIKPDAPAADRSYDAGAIVALAIAKAGKADPAAIKAAIPEVVAAGGEPIHAGKDEFAKALGLIKDGKPIKYEGVIGPVELRPVWRHHRPVPAVADQGRRGHDGRRDERRGRREGQEPSWRSKDSGSKTRGVAAGLLPQLRFCELAPTTLVDATPSGPELSRIWPLGHALPGSRRDRRCANRASAFRYPRRGELP